MNAVRLPGWIDETVVATKPIDDEHVGGIFFELGFDGLGAAVFLRNGVGSLFPIETPHVSGGGKALFANDLLAREHLVQHVIPNLDVALEFAGFPIPPVTVHRGTVSIQQQRVRFVA